MKSVCGVGEELQLALSALEPSLADEPPGPDSDHRLDTLITGPPWIAPWVEKRVHPLLLVVFQREIPRERDGQNNYEDTE